MKPVSTIHYNEPPKQYHAFYLLPSAILTSTIESLLPFTFPKNHQLSIITRGAAERSEASYPISIIMNYHNQKAVKHEKECLLEKHRCNIAARLQNRQNGYIRINADHPLKRLQFSKAYLLRFDWFDPMSKLFGNPFLIKGTLFY